MTLNDLLRAKGFEPSTVIVFRHRPHEPELNKVLPWLAAEKPDVFNAYQSTQTERAEQAMTHARYVASFIGREAGRATFVGVYEIGKAKPLRLDDFWRIPAHVELKKFGMKGFAEDSARKTVLWFDLSLVDFYRQWQGRLIVAWPAPERAWWRRAHKNDMEVLAILDESTFEADMPNWDQILLTWEDLGVLPRRWKARLSEWRAIYYIFDTSDGKSYVGAACGNANLLGRWKNYAERGHGGNVLLRQRDPKHFRFSILQRVSPDMDAADVIRLEATWKDRLHTRHPLGLNDN